MCAVVAYAVSYHFATATHNWITKLIKTLHAISLNPTQVPRHMKMPRQNRNLFNPALLTISKTKGHPDRTFLTFVVSIWQDKSTKNHSGK